MAAIQRQGQGFQGVVDMIPQDISQKFPGIVTALGQIVTANDRRQNLEPVIQVSQCLKPEVLVDSKTATELINKCVDHEMICMNRTAIIEQMCSQGECPVHVKKVVFDAIRNSTDMLLILSGVAGALHLLLTYIAIADLSEQIEKTDILGVETNAEILLIGSLLEEVPAKLEQLAQILSRMQSENIGTQEIKRLNNLQKLKAATIESILNNVEARIEKILQRNQEVRNALEKSRQGASTAGFNGIVGGVSNLANAGILLSAGSGYVIAINAGVGVFNVILGGAAIVKARSAKEKIDVIVAHMNSLKALKSDADRYRRELNEKKQEIVDLLMENLPENN